MRDANGRFLPGPDPDRHELTRAERKRGYRNAMASPDWRKVAYVFRKVRGYYRARPKKPKRRTWKFIGYTVKT